ncbi:MAG: hypothetical protein SCM96_02305 [Acidobacteriota bacterium]|nr:hypothetical protein [Acidobacteriota bacterium]
MEKAIEKLKKLTAALAENAAALEGCRVEAAPIEKRLSELHGELVKARVLKTPNLKELEAERVGLLERKATIEKELPERKEAATVLEEAVTETRIEAKRELLEGAWPAFVKAVKAFVVKLREAEAAEKAILKLKAETNEVFREAGGVIYAGVLPPLSNLLAGSHVVAVGRDGPTTATTVDLFTRECAEFGISLGDLGFNAVGGPARLCRGFQPPGAK